MLRFSSCIFEDLLPSEIETDPQYPGIAKTIKNNTVTPKIGKIRLFIL